MPRTKGTDRAARVLDAALALGVRGGVGALSLQAIAAEAEVSKALLLYHFADKAALLEALAVRVAGQNARRLREASRRGQAMAAWRALLLDPAARGEAALLGALMLEQDIAPSRVRGVHVEREAAATALAVAVLGDVVLTPRVPDPALGRLLLRQLDGLACAGASMDAAALDAELDTFALALIGLGR